MDEITLINLLNKISYLNRNTNWSINCKYQEGTEQTMLEILVEDTAPKSKRGLIHFDMATGLVEKFVYREFHPVDRPKNIKDLLFGIINFEKAKSLALNN